MHAFRQCLTRFANSHLRAPEAAFIVIVLASYLFVFPVGEYAILDDWAYVKSLEHLQNRFELRILDWNPMPLVGHLLWGLLFTLPFGLTFTTTKVAVVSAAAIQGLVILRLLRFSGVSSPFALLTASAIFFQPLYFPHCFMFMTDVPAMTWQWCSLLCLFRGLVISKEGAAAGWLLSGSVLAGLASVTRQHGILILGPVILELFYDSASQLRYRRLLSAVVPAVLIAGGYNCWYGHIHGWTSTFSQSLDSVTEFVTAPPWQSLPFIICTLLIYAGIFASPLTIPLILTTRYRTQRQVGSMLGLAWLLANAYSFFVWHERPFPLMRNVLTRWGYFSPQEFVLGDRPLLWGTWAPGAWSLLGLLSVLSLAGLLLTQVGWRDVDSTSRLRRLMLSFVILQFGYLFVTAPILFDRHLIILLPTLCVLCALTTQSLNGTQIAISLSILIVFAGYSAAATHDLHSASRAIFAAGEELLEQGVPAERIDGGYAFDGWHMYERSQRMHSARGIRTPPWWRQRRATVDPDYKMPWWTENLIAGIEPEYVVSLSPHIPEDAFHGTFQPQLRTSDRSYWAYWPPGTRQIYVLKKRPTGHLND